MEPGSKGQGSRQAEGVRQFLGQGERFVASLQGLVRIAKRPQNQGCNGQAGHPRVKAIAEGMGTVLLRIIEGNALLQVCLGRGQLSQLGQGRP